MASIRGNEAGGVGDTHDAMDVDGESSSPVSTQVSGVGDVSVAVTDLTTIQDLVINNDGNEDNGDESSDDEVLHRNASLPQFTCFPADLQFMVFQTALPTGRLIQLLKTHNTAEVDVMTFAASGPGSGGGDYLLTVPDGNNDSKSITALYHVNQMARAEAELAYQDKRITFFGGPAGNVRRYKDHVCFDKKTDKLLFAAASILELSRLYHHFDVANIRNFALAIDSRTATSGPRLLQRMLSSLFAALPTLKNLEIVVGPHWHDPRYEEEVKLIEMDGDFHDFVRDEFAWDKHGGLNELTNIRHVLRCAKGVEKAWEAFLRVHAATATAAPVPHRCTKVNFKVSTMAWLLKGGGDEGMYHLRFRVAGAGGGEGDDDEYARYGHMNIGYADEETGEVGLPPRIIFPKNYPGIDENYFIDHDACDDSDPDSNSGGGENNTTTTVAATATGAAAAAAVNNSGQIDGDVEMERLSS